MKRNSCGWCLNGRLVRERSINFPVLARGFLYGDGVFETLRARNYRVFRWPDHWQRLKNGLEACNLETKEKPETVLRLIQDLVRRRRLKDAYVRLNVWRRAPEHFDPDAVQETNMLIVCRKFKPYPAQWYRAGVCCRVSTKFYRNEKSLLAGIKSFNYLESVLARMEARKNGCFDSILLNTRGRLAETSTANLFLVKHRVVYTPAVKCGALPGVTRRVVLEICSRHGIKYQERPLTLLDLEKADEVFLTNTLMAILPVREVRGVFQGRNFTVTQLLRKHLQELFSRETNGK